MTRKTSRCFDYPMAVHVDGTHRLTQYPDPALPSSYLQVGDTVVGARGQVWTITEISDDYSTAHAA